MSVTGRRHESGDAVLVCYRHVRTLLEQQVYDTHVPRGACLLDTIRATTSGTIERLWYKRWRSRVRKRTKQAIVMRSRGRAICGMGWCACLFRSTNAWLGATHTLLLFGGERKDSTELLVSLGNDESNTDNRKKLLRTPTLKPFAPYTLKKH